MEQLKPMEIEERSFEIITEELKGRQMDPVKEPIIKRVIHTTADFEFADTLQFSAHAVERALDAIRKGADIVTDTNMAAAGINKAALAKSGSRVHCFMADADVAAEAKERGITRAAVCMEKAAELQKPLIFALGNAPTALLKLEELIKAGKLRPELIIGVPVGFVHVVESKEHIMHMDVEYIVAAGRKGGSNVAAAIVNALLYMAFPREK